MTSKGSRSWGCVWGTTISSTQPPGSCTSPANVSSRQRVCGTCWYPHQLLCGSMKTLLLVMLRGRVLLFGQTDCTIFNYYWARGERPDTLWQQIQNLGAPLGIANLVESWWYVGREIWIFEIASSALGSPGHVFRGRAQPTTARLYASEMWHIIDVLGLLMCRGKSLTSPWSPQTISSRCSNTTLDLVFFRTI